MQHQKKIISTNDATTTALENKLKTICDWLEEKKAQDLVALDISGQNSLTEGMIIAGASSLRHGQGLADHLLERCKKKPYEFLHMEGYQSGLWILLDLNDVLVSILQPEERQLYRLEALYHSGKVIVDARKA